MTQSTPSLHGDGSYSMLFWKSCYNPETYDRGNAAVASLKLTNALQSKLSTDRIVMPSVTKDEDGAVHIAVFLKTSSVELLDKSVIVRTLNTTAASLGYAYQQFAEEPTVLSDCFSAEAIQNINEAAQATSEKGSDGFRLLRDKVEKLRAATGDDLKAEIKSLMKVLKVKEDELAYSAWKTVLLLARGIAVYGGDIVSTLCAIQYTTYSMIALMSGGAVVLSYTGWIAMFFAPLAILVAALTGEGPYRAKQTPAD